MNEVYELLSSDMYVVMVTEVVAEIDMPCIMLKKMLERRLCLRSRILTDYIPLRVIWKVCLFLKNITLSKILLINVWNM
jgi:hypothetical protein